MKFSFTATTDKGVRREGVVEARTRADALRELKRKKLTVIALNAQIRGAQIFVPYVSALDKVILTKHLAIMLKAGIPISSALQTLGLQTNGFLKQVLKHVATAVDGGERLGDAMAAHPHVFNDYYVNMVRAGEESGHLPENLEQLSLRFAKDYDLKRRAQSAMFYPALVLTLTGGLGLLISLFVLPRLSTLFHSFNFQLPWPTRVLIALSNYLAHYGLQTAVLGVVAVVALVAVSRKKSVQPLFHRAYLRVPLLGRVARSVNLARFAMVFGSLLKSGVPINRALPITASVLSNEAYRHALHEAGTRVDMGASLSVELEKHPDLFPPFVIRMISVGERSGNMEEMLFYLSEFYEAELDATLKNLSTFIEPLLLIVIGLVVAFTALAIITPVYGFINAIE